MLTIGERFGIFERKVLYSRVISKPASTEDQGGGSVRIEKLTDTNFYIWKQKIQLLLALKDVDHHVFETEPPGLPESDERKTWLRGDNKAKAIIGLSLSDEHLEHVHDSETAKQMWEGILNVFERHILLNKLAARRCLYTVTIQNDEKVLAYINRVKQLAARLKLMKVDIDDKEMAMAVLNGLPSRFESYIMPSGLRGTPFLCHGRGRRQPDGKEVVCPEDGQRSGRVDRGEASADYPLCS